MSKKQKGTETGGISENSEVVDPTEKKVPKKQKKVKEPAQKKPPRRTPHWERLDNTANIFPVIAGEEMTNTYRISVVLNEEVQPELLQEAVNIVTPKIPGFSYGLRNGFFWYYLEEIEDEPPKIAEESTYPCRLIHWNTKNQYMFRVTYFGNKINLEAFHALADGMGGINFIRELTYQYLRLSHPDLRKKLGDGLSSETSLDREDSFVKNFEKRSKSNYKLNRAFMFRGEKLPMKGFGVVHGIMSVSELKRISREKYGISINEYLITAFIYSTYKSHKNAVSKRHPIRVAVPVNLRPFFESDTTKNFFVMVSAEFAPEKEDYSFDEIKSIVHKSLKEQITKENLEKTFSFAVSNSNNIIAKFVPLPLKNGGMMFFYNLAAKANTTTITNIGNIKLEEDYKPYVKMFYCILPFSVGQYMKGTFTSYEDTLVFTIGSAYRNTAVQEGIFRQLSKDGVTVKIETNGVYYE